MSYCRTTLIKYRSKQDADELISTYKLNASTDFPDAEVLLCTRTSDTSAVMTSLYPSREIADEAKARRRPILDEAKGKSKIESMETHEGDAFSLR